jgi:hypothetical protein
MVSVNEGLRKKDMHSMPRFTQTPALPIQKEGKTEALVHNLFGLRSYE